MPKVSKHIPNYLSFRDIGKKVYVADGGEFDGHVIISEGGSLPDIDIRVGDRFLCLDVITFEVFFNCKLNFIGNL